MSITRHNWTKEEILEIYNQPLMELLYWSYLANSPGSPTSHRQGSTLQSDPTQLMAGWLATPHSSPSSISWTRPSSTTSTQPWPPNWMVGALSMAMQRLWRGRRMTLTPGVLRHFPTGSVRENTTISRKGTSKNCVCISRGFTENAKAFEKPITPGCIPQKPFNKRPCHTVSMPYQRSQTLEKVKAVMKNVYLAQVHQKSVNFLKMDKLCIQVPLCNNYERGINNTF